MRNLLLAGAFALISVTGIASAQTTTSTSTTTVSPTPAPALQAPPPQTLATMHEQKIVKPDGTTTEKSETTYNDPSGVANQSVTKTVTPPVVQTTTTTSSTATTVMVPDPIPVSCPPRNRFDPVTEACVPQ
jgi:hypothetical protein